MRNDFLSRKLGQRVTIRRDCCTFSSSNNAFGPCESSRAKHKTNEEILRPPPIYTLKYKSFYVNWQ